MGEILVFGLNHKRDENKYINDYNFKRIDNKLIFEEKIYEEYKT